MWPMRLCFVDICPNSGWNWPLVFDVVACWGAKHLFARLIFGCKKGSRKTRTD